MMIVGVVVRWWWWLAVMRLRLMSRDRRLFNPRWCFVSWVFSFRHYWPHGGASVVAETCLLGFLFYLCLVNGSPDEADSGF
jgi:hypothetical protein